MLAVALTQCQEPGPSSKALLKATDTHMTFKPGKRVLTLATSWFSSEEMRWLGLELGQQSAFLLGELQGSEPGAATAFSLGSPKLIQVVTVPPPDREHEWMWHFWIWFNGLGELRGLFCGPVRGEGCPFALWP